MENKFGNWKRESKPHKRFDRTKGQGKVCRRSTGAFQKLCWDPWKRLFIGSFWTVLKWLPVPHHDRLAVKGWVVASELWRCAELGFSRARRWSPSTKSGAKRGGWARLSTNYSLKAATPPHLPVYYWRNASGAQDGPPLSSDDLRCISCGRWVKRIVLLDTILLKKSKNIDTKLLGWNKALLEAC